MQFHPFGCMYFHGGLFLVTFNLENKVFNIKNLIFIYLTNSTNEINKIQETFQNNS